MGLLVSYISTHEVIDSRQTSLEADAGMPWFKARLLHQGVVVVVERDQRNLEWLDE
jgi:hypothetical protein